MQKIKNKNLKTWKKPWWKEGGNVYEKLKVKHNQVRLLEAPDFSFTESFIQLMGVLST